MSKLIELKLNETEKVLIEIVDNKKKYQQTGITKKIAEKVNEEFEKMIVPCIISQCQAFSNAFSEIKRQNLHPKTAETEFSLQFNGEGQIYVAKVGGEANYRVKFEWEF